MFLKTETIRFYSVVVALSIASLVTGCGGVGDGSTAFRGTSLATDFPTTDGGTAAALQTTAQTVPIESSSIQSTILESDGWQIHWDDSNGVARRMTPPSERVILYTQPDPLNECDYNEIIGGVLSVVGSIVSFETHHGWYCQGNAHPGNIVRFQTIDLNTGAEVDIRQLVPDTHVVTALKKHELINKALAGSDPTDLQSLIDHADGGCEVSFLFLATSFAVYELRNDKVAVRFGLGHGCEVMRGNLTEIEIDLPFPKDLDVEAADVKGHLMKTLAPGPTRGRPI